MKIDAYAAAAAVLSGAAAGIPKTRDGAVEAIRTLQVARRSAMKVARRRSTSSGRSYSPGRPSYAGHRPGRPPGSCLPPAAGCALTGAS
jgi:hypothetical protein